MMDKAVNPVPARTVDEYLQGYPENVQHMLQQLRNTIKATAPGAEEVISYQIPTYKYQGPLIHFAAFKKHCSLIGVSKKMLEVFKEELKAYHTAGSTIRFTTENPLPVSLVRKIVKFRMKENEERLKK